MKDLLKFSLPGNPKYWQAIKLAVGSAAGTANFSIEAVEDIEIAVSEACKNITCHGTDGFSDIYEIKCELDDEQIVITVTDISDHTLKKDKKPCLDCPNEGELGIHIINTLMDEVEICKASQGKKSIKMVKNKC